MVTASITAFKPGASPPPVLMQIFFLFDMENLLSF